MPDDVRPVRGLALHIGLNQIDPDHYGSDGRLLGCHEDARDMQTIAQAQGFSPQGMLLDADATRDAVIGAITEAARTLRAGDIYLVTYAGHGGQVDDLNDDEMVSGAFDFQDETWCLFDAQLIDDELAVLWSKFQPGVRILLISDSCHSGTVARNLDAAARARMESNVQGDKRFRYLPPRFLAHAAMHHRQFYRQVADAADTAQAPIRACLVQLSGCQDDQLSQDTPFNGLFTRQLERVWDDGAFHGDMVALHRTICERMPPDQQPNLLMIGDAGADFTHQRPFSVDPAAPVVPTPVAAPMDVAAASVLAAAGGSDDASALHTPRGDFALVEQGTEPVRLPDLSADPTVQLPQDLVAAAQEALQLAGFTTAAPTGRFDPETDAAVRRFQATQGIPQDGVLTEDDWMVLLALLPDQVEDVERLYPWRWGTRSLATGAGLPFLTQGIEHVSVAVVQLLLQKSGFWTKIDADFGSKTDGKAERIIGTMVRVWTHERPGLGNREHTELLECCLQFYKHRRDHGTSHDLLPTIRLPDIGANALGIHN